MVYVRSRCKDREPHAQVTCPSHMPLSGVQNPVVFTCWFAAVCHALSPMASISADLRLFCARMSAAEIGLQAIYYTLAFLLGLLGPAVFFMGHDPLHLFNTPFHFRWQLSLMLTAGGIAYGCVLAITRRFFARYDQRRIHVSSSIAMAATHSKAQ